MTVMSSWKALEMLAQPAAQRGCLLFTIPSLPGPLSDVTTILVHWDTRAHRYTCPASPDGREARPCVAVVDNAAVTHAHTETLSGPGVSSVVLFNCLRNCLAGPSQRPYARVHPSTLSPTLVTFFHSSYLMDTL